MPQTPPTRLRAPATATSSREVTTLACANANVVLDVLAYDVAHATPQVANAACGAVVAVGDLAGEWQGKQAVVPAHFPCGECETCRRGGVFVCASDRSLAALAAGLPRYLEVPARWLVPLPEGTPPTPGLAQLGGAALHAYTMYAHANVGPRDVCVVLGEGALAWWLARLLADKGAHVVTIHGGATAATERPDGLTHLASGDDLVPSAALAQGLLDAATAADAATHPWRLFVAEPRYLALATQLANPFANVVVATLPGAEPPTLAMGMAWDKGLTLTFIRDGHPDLLADVLGLVLGGGFTWQTLG